MPLTRAEADAFTAQAKFRHRNYDGYRIDVIMILGLLPVSFTPTLGLACKALLGVRERVRGARQCHGDQPFLAALLERQPHAVAERLGSRGMVLRA